MCCDFGGVIAMQELSESQDHTFVSGIARWWKEQVGNWAGRAELEDFDPDELRRVAMEVGLNARELCSMAGKWPDSSNQLLRRMAVLELDVTEIARSQPGVSNDLKKLCSFCVSKRRCDHDLAANEGNPEWREYCPNVGTLAALIAG
jgi:hypothetical protein